MEFATKILRDIPIRYASTVLALCSLFGYVWRTAVHGFRRLNTAGRSACECSQW